MSTVKIGRPASANPTGLKPVKGHANRPAGTSMADAFRASGIDTEKLKRSLKPQNKSAGELLNEQITARMGQKSKYGGKTVKVGNTYVAQSAAETAQRAQTMRTTKGIVSKTQQALNKKTPISAGSIDQSLGLGRAPKSAQESMGVFVKNDVEQALKRQTPLNPGAINRNLGLAGAPKSAKESAEVFMEHGLTKTEKTINKPSVWSRIKKGISSLWSKAKSAIKSPKGKWGLVIAAIATAALGVVAYLSDRFSDKNKSPHTSGAESVPVPKTAKDSVEEIETVVEPEETDKKTEEKTDKAAKDVDETGKSEPETKVVPVPVPVDEDETDETGKTDETEPESKADKADEATEKPETENAPVPVKPGDVSGDTYEVVKGDCVWNIAKAHLKELNKDKTDYVPSNLEILNHTKELMEINDLHFEADNYHVMIKPGEKLKLKK